MTLAVLIVAAGGVLLVTSRTAVAVVAYVVLAAAATVLIAPAVASSPAAVVAFSITTAMKVVVAPLVLLGFLHAQPAARALQPSLAIPLRLLLAIAIAVLGLQSAMGLGIAVIAVGAAALLVHRNLIAQLIGLLALGTGVTLCGAVLAPGLPETVELGATFDALVGTFIGLALVRAFAAHDPLLDVESLRRLRG
jgi:hydrogenase-4 membrane subunit HyfE